MSFTLSAELESHEDDVKAVAVLSNTEIVSVSRDETVRVWSNASVSSNSHSTHWTPSLIYKGTGFINAVAYLPEVSVVAFGGTDGMIRFIHPTATDLEPLLTLPAHAKNVCSLSYANGLLASGSWDGTAKIWNVSEVLSTGPTLVHELGGHEGPVWDVKVVAPSVYLTAGADGTVRRWEGSQQVKLFSPHSDVVRCVLPLPQGLATCSNDGTIAILSTDGVLQSRLMGHTSFVYQLAVLPSGEVVSCGEDRTVRIWKGDACVQVLTLPTVTIWTVAVLENGDLVTGSSDNVVRVFTRDEARQADAGVRGEFSEAVRSQALAPETLSAVDEDLPGLEALATAGTKEGQTLMLKNDATGVVEAHQWSMATQEWIKIGDVVGRGGSGSDKKVEYKGAKWDFLFDVDVEEGAPALKLPFNLNENPHLAAERFLSTNDLPTSYTEQVVQFILTNTQGINLGAQVEKPYDPYQDRNELTLLPVRQYLYFDKLDVGSLTKGLTKLSESETTFAVDLAAVTRDLTLLALREDAAALAAVHAVASGVIENWSLVGKLVGFDILRALIPLHKTKPANLETLVMEGLRCESPLVLLVLLRCFANLFATTWGTTFLTFNDPTSTFDVLVVLLTVNDEYQLALSADTKPTHVAQLSLALANLYYNCSVWAVRDSAPALQTKVLTALAHVAEMIIVRGGSEEAAYRLAVGCGNLMTVKHTAKPKWLVRIREKYAVTGNSRFAVVWEDIEKI